VRFSKMRYNKDNLSNIYKDDDNKVAINKKLRNRKLRTEVVVFIA